MKIFKNFTSATLLVVTLFLGGNAFAQQGQAGRQGAARLTVEERAQMQTNRFQKQLDLTPEQATTIKAIILASAQEIDKLRSAGTEASRETMVALNQKRTEQIMAVLTPEQKEKFEQQKSAQQAKMRERAASRQGQEKGGNKKKKGGNAEGAETN